ncbi:OppA family ABC transporter substrate-binding lipoprotein [Mycoplasma marinum]|uniref:OppA family ABC transporter substrate-binding lipoprotein n=1 Tax=Mycoplasma marinum TaxID=1937190 RepID=UPI003B328BE3
MTKKQKNKFLLGAMTATAVVAAPIATVVSCGFEGDYSTNYLHDRREIHVYGTLSDSKERSFDQQYNTGNLFGSGSETDAARALPLLVIKATGENVGKISNGFVNGVYHQDKIGMKWVETTKEEMSFSGAQKLFGTIDGKTWEPIDIKKIDEKSVKDKLAKYTKYKFFINEDKKAKWMNSKGEATKYPLDAKDYFYGFMRSLYSSRQTRQTGKIAGVSVKGVVPFDKAWTTNEIDLSSDNPNNYIFNLFGMDIDKTIADGEKLKNGNQEFVITLKTPNDKFLSSVICNFTGITPAPSKYISEMAKGSTKPWIKYGIANYGNDLKTFLHVAPYYYSKYDLLTGFILKKNEGFIDQDWANDRDLPKGQARINKYVYHATQKQDAIAEIIQRKAGYEEGKEPILDASVINDNTELNKIKNNAEKYGVKLSRVINSGMQQKMFWNPLPNDKFLNEYNDKARELMYGFSKIEDIKNKPSAFKHFMIGDAAKLRHAIDLAYNWYAGVQQVTGNSTKMPLLSPFAPEQVTPVDTTNVFDDPKNATPFATPADLIAAETREPSKITEAQKIYVRPSGVPSYADLKNSYAKANNKLDAAISPSMQEAKDLIKSIADKYAGAVIPLETWNDKNKNPASQQTLSQVKTMIKVLNKIAPGKITFKTFVPEDWNTHVHDIQYHDAQLQYRGWSKDYDAASSVLQGIMDPRPTAALIGQYLDDKNNTELKKLISNSPKGKYDTFAKIVDKISLKEWKQYALSSYANLDKEKVKGLLEGSALTSGGYLKESSNSKFIGEAVSFLQNNALYFHTAVTYRSIIITDRLQGSFSIVVQKKWLHTRTQRSGQNLLRDYSVDL